MIIERFENMYDISRVRHSSRNLRLIHPTPPPGLSFSLARYCGHDKQKYALEVFGGWDTPGLEIVKY
jgi:hypothetical protein